jgi:hypothetical protein
MRARFTVPALMLVALCAAPAAAQTVPSDGGPFMVLSVIDVKPDMYAEFGDVQAATMAGQQKGGQIWRETWHVVTFGEPYRVRVMRPLMNFAELDGQSFTIKGVGAEQAAAINERARGMIERQQIYALRPRPDLGYGDRPAEIDLAVLTTITVAPGREAEFEAIVRDAVMPAFKKAGEAYLSVSQVVLGGAANQYIAFNLYNGFADVDTKGDPVLRGMGPEGFAKYRQRLAGIVLHEERELLRLNPALSFRAVHTP